MQVEAVSWQESTNVSNIGKRKKEKHNSLNDDRPIESGGKKHVNIVGKRIRCKTNDARLMGEVRNHQNEVETGRQYNRPEPPRRQQVPQRKRRPSPKLKDYIVVFRNRETEL